MSYFNRCPHCGDNLDPGEMCDRCKDNTTKGGEMSSD